jgi:hypothetical protein
MYTQIFDSVGQWNKAFAEFGSKANQLTVERAEAALKTQAEITHRYFDSNSRHFTAISRARQPQALMEVQSQWASEINKQVQEDTKAFVDFCRNTSEAYSRLAQEAFGVFYKASGKKTSA